MSFFPFCNFSQPSQLKYFTIYIYILCIYYYSKGRKCKIFHYKEKLPAKIFCKNYISDNFNTCSQKKKLQFCDNKFSNLCQTIFRAMRYCDGCSLFHKSTRTNSYILDRTLFTTPIPYICLILGSTLIPLGTQNFDIMFFDIFKSSK